MKKKLHRLFLAAVVSISASAIHAQQVSTFDNLTLLPNSYWDGSKTLIKDDTMFVDTIFTSGDAIFPNRFSRQYPNYPYWADGWAYSNLKDVTTNGTLFNAFTGSGYNSDNYAVGQHKAIIHLNANAKGGKVKGLYVTNSTYAGLVIKEGNFAARKFGDTTGTNSSPQYPQDGYPDWFKLTIKGYLNGTLKTDSVDFYLADYRFSDNSNDYVVNTWEWVGLDTLGQVDSLLFLLSSTDNHPIYGMNTPAFFCMDDFTTESLITTIAKVNVTAVKMYPNPAADHLTIDLNAFDSNSITSMDIFDISGKLIESILINKQRTDVSVSAYKSGVYFISVKNENGVINAKFIKE